MKKRANTNKRQLSAKLVRTVLTFIVCAIIGALWFQTRPTLRPLSVLLESDPLTSYPRTERNPAFSPDGNQIAFVWDCNEGTAYDIYVKQLNADPPLRLTDHPQREEFPAWSPDGSTIAFIRRTGDGGIFTVPSIGGEVTRLTDTYVNGEGLDWSPDGRWIAFSRFAGVGESNRIALISTETREIHDITFPTLPYLGDTFPAFSPDGSQLVFVRLDGAQIDEIYSVAIDGGEPEKLINLQCDIYGVDWTPDGKHLIFAACRPENHRLMRYTFADGKVTWLPTPGGKVMRPNVSASGNHLVYEEVSMISDIHQISLDERGTSDFGPKPLIRSTRRDYAARYSADGTRLAFLSTRSGQPEVWICQHDGRNPYQLTRFKGPKLMEPHWSPDGQQVAVTAMVDSVYAIYLVNLEDRAQKRLTDSTTHYTMNMWSRDNWLYYDASLEDGWQIKRMTPDGDQITNVSPDSIGLVNESPCGEILYYTKRGLG